MCVVCLSVCSCLCFNVCGRVSACVCARACVGACLLCIRVCLHMCVCVYLLLHARVRACVCVCLHVPGQTGSKRHLASGIFECAPRSSGSSAEPLGTSGRSSRVSETFGSHPKSPRTPGAPILLGCLQGPRVIGFSTLPRPELEPRLCLHTPFSQQLSFVLLVMRFITRSAVPLLFYPLAASSRRRVS